MAVRRLGGRIVAFAATVALSIPLGLLTNSAWAVEDATRSDSTTQMSSTPEVVYSSAVDSKQNRTSDFDANWKFMLSDSVQAQDPAFDDSAGTASPSPSTGTSPASASPSTSTACT